MDGDSSSQLWFIVSEHFSIAITGVSFLILSRKGCNAGNMQDTNKPSYFPLNPGSFIGILG